VATNPANEAVRRLGRHAAYRVQANLVEAVVNIEAQAIILGISDLAKIAEAITAGALTSQQLGKVHTEIARAAQRSTAAAFDQRRPRRRIDKLFPAYRERPNRFAGGALRRAIMKADFVHADAHGISFVNEALLNTEAGHWKRLNFGAGGGAIAPPRSYAVNWGGLVVAALGLQPDPQPAFRMPPGFWLRGSRPQEAGAPGTGGFFPTRRRPLRTPTFGIVATNFLDAGVRRIAREFPIAYQNLLDQYMTSVQIAQPALPSRVIIRGHGATIRADLAPEVKAAYNDLLEIYRRSGRPELLQRRNRTQGPGYKVPVPRR
jgi:hypothetical protein